MPLRRTRPFPPRAKANRTWGGTSSTAVTAVAANTKVLLGSFVLSNPGIDETVLRTVGSLMVSSDQLAGNEAQIGALGIILVTDVALAVGAASLPGPITNSSDDGWLLYVPFTQRFGFLTAAGFSPDFGKSISFDSKAKRRVHDGYSLAIVIENGSSAHGIEVAIVLRMLTMVS